MPERLLHLGGPCCLYGQDSVRGCPIVLAAASRTPPIALLLSVPRRNTPNVVFKLESVPMRAYVRQGDPSLTGTMIRLERSVLFRRISVHPHLLALPLVAFSHLHTSPCAELVISTKKTFK